MSENEDRAEFSAEDRRLFAQQGALADDLAVVVEYATAVDADEWGGLWFDNDRDPVVLVIAVTRRVEEHAANLHNLVANPEQLHVVKVENSLQALRDLQDEINALRGQYPISGTGVNEKAGIVRVGLSVDDPAARAELQKRFGPSVRVDRGVWKAWAP